MPMTQMTPENVLDFLRENPDFLAQHPEFFPEAPMQTGNVVNFQQAMVSKLRQDKQRADDRTRNMVDNARQNMTLLSRIHAAVVRLLEARHFDELNEMINTELALMLEVDVVALVMEGEPDDQTANVRFVEPGMIDAFLEGQDSQLHTNMEGDERLYGPAARLVKSQALLRLTMPQETPDALLIFGSRDPLMFTDGQGTELIGFLGDVIERLIRRFTA
jgi:uncharacterized protein YigA (DUF484 family)